MRAFFESIGNRWLAQSFNIAEIEQTVGQLSARPVALHVTTAALAAGRAAVLDSPTP